MIEITLKPNDIPSNTSHKLNAFWYLHVVLNAHLKYLTSTTCTKPNNFLCLKYDISISMQVKRIINK